MKVFPLTILLIVLAASGCGEKEEEQQQDAADTTATTVPTKWSDHGITLSLKEDSPEFPDAELLLKDVLVSPAKTKFVYEVKNYELKAQTPGADHCANSKDGQHIHLILNNEPYLARYTTEFEEPLKTGHYVCLSFLSRSYHESIKNGKAYDLRQFSVGATARFAPADLTKPMVFYSRPKGEYIGADAQHILLDFFLANCDLSETGYRVKLTVNDSAQFTLTTWAPYIIEGMLMGENTIELELVDANGARVETLYNPVKRTIVLKEG